MDMIKAKLRKIKSAYTIGVHKRPLVFTILLVFAINLVILIISAIIAHSIDDNYTSVINAFATGSIKWMLTPNSILAIENTSTMFLAGTVVVLEMVLFSGVVIAMTTNALKDYFAKKSGAEGNLFLEDHIIIFNWNSKVAQIIKDLMYSGKPSTVLIYSSKNKAYVTEEINNVLKENKEENVSKVNVIVKNGNPINKTGLKEISIENAKSIIIMSREDIDSVEEQEFSNADLFNIKALICIGTMPLKENCSIIIEVSEVETLETVKEMSLNIDCLTDNHIIPIAFNRRLGQFISQFILNAGLEKVYSEVFSFQGSEFYPVKDMELEEGLAKLNKSIPITKISDKLFVLAESIEDSLSVRNEQLSSPKKIKLIDKIDNEKYSIIIVGSNHKKRYIIESLENYKTTINKNLMIKAFETIDSAIIEYIENSHERCVVMILSDENYDLRGLDSNVYAAVIKLQKIIKKIPSLKIIVELLDPINHDIIADFNVENTIVSNRLISLLITQLATNPQKYDFLEKLIEIKVDDNEVFDIKIGKVADMIDKSNLDFNSNAELVSSYYYSSGAKRILIGTNINNEIKYFSNNLDSNNIKLNLEDELIYIQY